MRKVALLLVFATAACGEAPFKAPRINDAGLDGAPKHLAGFPSGDWYDDFGNVLAVKVSGDTLSGSGKCGPALGMTLTGKIRSTALDFEFTDGAGTSFATGHAELVNDRHAFFETTYKDGAAPSEGLIHFLHDSPARLASNAPPSACTARPYNPPHATPPKAPQ